MNHACVTTVLAFASSELGTQLAGYTSGTLYLCYTFRYITHGAQLDRSPRSCFKGVRLEVYCALSYLGRLGWQRSSWSHGCGSLPGEQASAGLRHGRILHLRALLLCRRPRVHPDARASRTAACDASDHRFGAPSQRYTHARAHVLCTDHDAGTCGGRRSGKFSTADEWSWALAMFGAALGGVAAGWLWVAQAGYMTVCTAMYTGKRLPRDRVSSDGVGAGADAQDSAVHQRLLCEDVQGGPGATERREAASLFASTFSTVYLGCVRPSSALAVFEETRWWITRRPLAQAGMLGAVLNQEPVSRLAVLRGEGRAAGRVAAGVR